MALPRMWGADRMTDGTKRASPPVCQQCDIPMVTPPGEPVGSLEHARSWECPDCGSIPPKEWFERGDER